MDFKQSYQEALKYKENANYDMSWEIFRKLLQEKEEFISAPTFYEIAEVLIKLERIAQAGLYLRKALKISRKQENAAGFYLIAKINIHLEDTKASLFYLKKAIDAKPEYGIKAWNDEAFEDLKNQEKFIKLINKSFMHKNHSSQKQKLFYENKKNKNNKTSQAVLELLTKNEWETNTFADFAESNPQTDPEVVAEYTQNPTLNFRIAYYQDNSLVQLKLENAEDVEDNQIYRFYTEENINDFLKTLINYQNKLTPKNWEDFLENIIPTCKEVAFEMPDGRQVKIS